jgi:hypothetical protein
MRRAEAIPAVALYGGADAYPQRVHPRGEILPLLLTIEVLYFDFSRSKSGRNFMERPLALAPLAVPRWYTLLLQR